MSYHSVDQVNALSGNAFIALLGNVIESWPLGATFVFENNLPVISRSKLVLAFQTYLDHLSTTDKVNILQLHPDLAGRLAAEGKLTAESTEEQRLAGLDRLSSKELEELQTLNAKYFEKFGFPFVICVRQAKRIEAILAGLRRRLGNERDVEVLGGIEEVKHICGLRIEQLVQDTI